MPLSTKPKSGKGIPRRSFNKAKKHRHAVYWQRAKCLRCATTFSSPRKKALHVQAGHTGNYRTMKDLSKIGT